MLTIVICALIIAFDIGYLVGRYVTHQLLRYKFEALSAAYGKSNAEAR